jgi:hypothetical protein
MVAIKERHGASSPADALRIDERVVDSFPSSNTRTLLKETSFRAPKEIVCMHPLYEKAAEALSEVQTEVGYEADQERQQEVLSRVDWEALSLEVDALQNANGGKKKSSEGAGKMLRGLVFEYLINADEQFGERRPIEKEILALAHNPDQFGLGDVIGHHRNPDMAFLLIKENDRLVIIGVGESKLGRLNERAFRQLSSEGFAQGITALVKVVNSIDDLEKYGLIELSKVKKEKLHTGPLLTIAPHFMQTVIVPGNRKPEWVSTLINYRDFGNRGARDEFRKLLQDPDRVRIETAAFSTAEVSAITKAIASK